MSEIDDPSHPLVVKIEAGICPECGHPLTDPAKSPNGWAWCRNPICRRPFKVIRQFKDSPKCVMTMDHETFQRQYPGKLPPEVTRRWGRR